MLAARIKYYPICQVVARAAVSYNEFRYYKNPGEESSLNEVQKTVSGQIEILLTSIKILNCSTKK